MFTLNPFNSRSQNAKVTNWRILQLRGLKAAINHLIHPKVAGFMVREIDVEIDQAKKIYADYLRVQFSTRAHAECKLKDPDAMCKDCVCWKQTRANCS